MSALLGLHMGSDNSYTQYEDFGTTFLKGAKVMSRVSFAAQSVWTDIAGPYFINSATKPWLATDPNRIEVLTVALVPNSPDSGTTNNTLTAVSGGQTDSYWTTLGTNIHNTGHESQIIVRLGWEMNGDWYNWGIGNGHNGNTAAQYVAAFRQAASLIKAKAPGVRFEWNLSLTGRNISWSSAYPGNDIVDVISMDVYDSYNAAHGGWAGILDGSVNTVGQGLTAFRSFCQSNGKPEAYTEWSLDTSANGNGDKISYIQLMHAWFLSGNVLHHGYYNSSAWSGSAMVYGSGSGGVPRGSQIYQILFSQPTSLTTLAASGGKPVGTPPDNPLSVVSDGANFYYALAA